MNSINEYVHIIQETHKRIKKHIKQNMLGIKKFETLRKLFIKELRKQGFKYFKCGGYKIVYRHPNYPTLLIKIHRFGDGWVDDTSKKSDLPSYLRKYFLRPIKRTKLYVIQERANNNSGDWDCNAEEALFELIGTDKRINDAKDMDIYSDNIQFHNGKPVIIDFCK